MVKVFVFSALDHRSDCREKAGVRATTSFAMVTRADSSDGQPPALMYSDLGVGAHVYVYGGMIRNGAMTLRVRASSDPGNKARPSLVASSFS